MSDPCLRKNTNPLPVCAPQKPDRATVGDIIDSLIEFNSGTRINMDGDRIEEVKNNLKRPLLEKQTFDLGEEKPQNETKHLNDQDGIASTPNLGENTTLEADLTLSDDDTAKIDKSQKWKLVSLSIPKKQNTSRPSHKSITNKTLYKSKEYISDDDSSSDEKPGKTTPEVHTTPKEPPNKQIKVHEIEVPRKKLKLLNYTPSQPEKNKCSYVFKNHPRKGIKCGQDSRGELCSTHKKLTSGVNPVHDRGGVDRLEKELENIKKQMQEKNDENSKKIEKLEKEVELLKHLVDEIKSRSEEKKETNEQYKNTKINKLRWDKKYKLIKYVDNEEAVFESDSFLYKIKIPSSIKKPQPQDNLYLTFNAALQKFDWSKS